MNLILRDMRYAFRSLSRDAGFACVACLSLALGIGANTAIFTITNSVLLSSIPVRDLASLVAVFWVDHSTGGINQNARVAVAYLNYKDLQARNDVFSGVAAFTNLDATLGAQRDGKPRIQRTILVSANYFDVLGVKPVLGRAFAPDEDRKPGGNAVVMLSFGVWTDLFAASPTALGKTIVLNSVPYTVIGVAPRGFKGTVTVSEPNVVWAPISMFSEIAAPPTNDLVHRRYRQVLPIARLKPGVDIARAAASTRVLAAALEKEYPWENRGSTFEVCPLSEIALGNLPREKTLTAAVALAAVAALVLLVACSNIASLMLVRFSKRSREVGIRTALGATREHLMRQFLTESLLLSVTGGAAGLVLGVSGSRLLWSFRPAFLAQDSIELHVDGRVLLFTAAVALTTSVFFGLAPALHASAPNLSQLMNTGGRSGTDSWSRHRLRNLFVSCEIAIAFVTLVFAGLLIRGTQQAQRVDLGFETRNLLVVSFDISSRRYSEERGLQFLRSVLDKAASVPGVRSAALSSGRPFGGMSGRTLLSEEQDGNPNIVGTITQLNAISPGYFDTTRIRIEEGRVFTEADRAGSKLVAVVNRAMAQQFWPGQNAIGKRFRLRDERGVLREVVGVAGNCVVNDVGEPDRPVAYIPLAQFFRPRMTLNVRTSASPNSILPAVLSRVQPLDSNLVLVNPQTVDQLVAQGLWAPNTGAALFGAFGILGTILASVGIYGVMASLVAQRTNEIGIRMALGGAPGDVFRMVLSQGLALGAVGIGFGLAGALALTRLIGSLLFHVSPYDLPTFAVTGIAIAVAAVMACWLPARRASLLDPVVAIRRE